MNARRCVYVNCFLFLRTRISRTVFDIEVKAYVPKIFMEGLYEGVGSFGLIELNSKGYFNVTAGKFLFFLS